MISLRFKFPLSAFFLFCLAGCGILGVKTSPPEPAPPSWQQHQRDLTALTHWQLQGKLGIRLATKTGSANLDWRQSATDYDLFLSGPFGQGSVQLSGNSDYLEIQVAGEEQQTTYAPQQIMREHLGFDIPISALAYWVKGLPAPQYPAQLLALDEHQRLAELEQLGWHVSYTRYQQLDKLVLPERISLQREDVTLRFIAKRWTYRSAADAD